MSTPQNMRSDRNVERRSIARRSSGGAANQAGTDFQNHAAAWVAVHILAERAASPPWDLPEDSTIEFLRCETEQPVDDLLVGTSADGYVYVQVKHTLRLQAGSESGLATALDQFVRQFVLLRDASGPNRWERPLDPTRDRLVLLTGPASSEPILQHLPAILIRLRSRMTGQRLEDAARSQAEQQTVRVIRDHLTRSWNRHTQTDPSDDDLRRILSLVRVHILDIEYGGTAEGEAMRLLRSAILHDADQAEVAWNTLVQACAGYAASSGGGDRAGLQRLLLDVGISLRAVHSYRQDIDALRRHSRMTLNLLSNLAKIRVGTVDVRIRREATNALRRAAEEGPLAVIGEPGAGKSGALHDLVTELQREGRDVVYLAVDRWDARSLGALQQEMGLEHGLVDILENWHGPGPGFLVIDALDAARSDQSAQTFRDVIRQAMPDSGHWRVIASIREYDLRHSDEVRCLFGGTPPSEFQNPRIRQGTPSEYR